MNRKRGKRSDVGMSLLEVIVAVSIVEIILQINDKKDRREHRDGQ